MWGWFHKMVGLRAGQGDLERERVPASADIKGGNGLEEKCGNEVEEEGCPRKNFVNQTQGSGLPALKLQVTFSVDAITY